jgi:hypothetical protein
LALSRRHITVFIVTAGVLLAVGAAVAKWRETRAFYQPASLLARFPAEDTIVLSADLSMLRAAGFLGAAKAPLEPEYKQFMENSGFDYRRDLDSVIASFSMTGNYFIARGRFNWARLRDYAAKQGGGCYEELCRMQGSTPDRRISFVPLRFDTIALAVSTDDLAATKLTHSRLRLKDVLPGSPVWLTIPGTVLRQQGGLPPGLRVVFSGLMHADRVVFTAGTNAGGVEVRMEATCKSEADARILTAQLQNAASLLKTDSDELAKVVLGGKYEQSGPRVTGKWPLSKETIDNLTAGL